MPAYHHASPHTLLAVDPGKHQSAVSAWWVTPEGARLLRASKIPSGHILTAAMHADPGDLVWVVERPQRYHRRTATHRNLVGLEHVCKHIVHAASTRDHWSAFEVRPRVWKGQVPKHIHHARVLAAMGPRERHHWGSIVRPHSAGYDHDIADAIALGYWAVGLLGVGGVRP